MAEPVHLKEVFPSILSSINQFACHKEDEKEAPLKLSEIFQKIKTAIDEQRFERVNAHFTSIVIKKKATFTPDVLKIFFTCLFDIQKKDLPETEEYKSLIPFNSFEEFQKIFFEIGPKSTDFIIDKAASSGKGLKGLEERVFIAIQHHFFVEKEQNQEIAMLCEAEMLSSRFVDREIPNESVIHLRTGIFYVSATFALRGAYISILRNIKEEGIPKIICRGTASRCTATSGIASCLNDVLPDMGMLGIQAVWPQLSLYLQTQKIMAVEIFGKSLGGAIAQKLAVMIEGILKIHVENLVTVASVGVGDEINSLFQEKILQHRKTPFNITVIRNGGDDERGELDYVPVFGGTHLGEKSSSQACSRRVYILAPLNSKIDPIPLDKSYFFYVKKLYASLQAPHCRQTTINPFRYSVIVEPLEVDSLLRIGNIFENVRLSGSGILKKITFSYFDYRFNDYFNEQEKIFLKSSQVEPVYTGDS